MKLFGKELDLVGMVLNMFSGGDTKKVYDIGYFNGLIEAKKLIELEIEKCKK